MKHKVGDRVYRPQDVYVTDSPMMSGLVTEVYDATFNYGAGPVYYPELYKVLWDHGKKSSYLPHGICRRPCGNPDCSTSTAIDEVTITYGHGELDDHGFWEHPCKPCADQARELGEEHVWP